MDEAQNPDVAIRNDDRIEACHERQAVSGEAIEREIKNPSEKQHHSTDAAAHMYPSGWTLAIVITSLCFGTLLLAIDNTIIGVAIPKITTVFDALDDVGWYGSSYLLTVTALQPVFGNVYKYFGVKASYLASILIFEVGSVLCAAAPNSPVFIFGPAVAGVGSAGLFQGALAVIQSIVPLEKRPLYLGIVVSVFGFATCSSPILGGAFTTNVSWRWCFWINVPVGGVVLVMIFVFLHLKATDDTDRRVRLMVKLNSVDFPGAPILIAAVFCLLLGLQWGGTTLPWHSSRIIGLFIGFGLLIIAFSALQWRLGERATVPPRLLRQRSVMMGCGFEFFANISLYVGAYYIPFYFQSAQGVSATQSGIRYIPYALPQIVAIVMSGAIAMKNGHYVPLMIFGVVVASVGTGLLTLIGVDTPTIQWASYLVVAGIGVGAGIQLPYTALQVVLRQWYVGDMRPLVVGKTLTTIYLAPALMVFFQQLGGAMAVPIGETIFVHNLLRNVPKYTTAVPAQAVVAAGATNLGSLTSNANVLRAFRISYSKAVTSTLYLATAGIAAALPFAIGMQWRNIKKVSIEKASVEKPVHDDKIEV